MPSCCARRGEKPSPHRKVWFNGDWSPPTRPSVSVFDHGLLYGDGVFEGIRGLQRTVLKLRTPPRAAVRIGTPASPEHAILDRRNRKGHPRHARSQRPDRRLHPPLRHPRHGHAWAQPLHLQARFTFIIADSIQLYPQEMYDNGWRSSPQPTIRNHPAALSPRIKSMNYLNNIMAKIEAINAGVRRSGHAQPPGVTWPSAPATTCSSFAWAASCHAPLHAGILEGVTRNLVIELAEQAGIEIIQRT
jgi:branched-chain amino acid aminotransferase